MTPCEPIRPPTTNMLLEVFLSCCLLCCLSMASLPCWKTRPACVVFSVAVLPSLTNLISLGDVFSPRDALLSSINRKVDWVRILFSVFFLVVLSLDLFFFDWLVLRGDWKLALVSLLLRTILGPSWDTVGSNSCCSKAYFFCIYLRRRSFFSWHDSPRVLITSSYSMVTSGTVYVYLYGEFFKALRT